MAQKNNKPHGHYCYVCGEHKANEKFSGRGHANHICKKCHALPAEKRNEMIAVRKIDNMSVRYLSQAEIKWLRKKMKSPNPEVREAASGVYEMRFSNHSCELEKISTIKTPVLFSELDDERKAQALERLEELISDYFEFAEYLPEPRDRDEILSMLCSEVSETLNEYEPEPYSPIIEYYDPRFDFGPEVSFDERISIIQETLDANAEDDDPYAEPEEPEHISSKELVADDALKTTFDKLVSDIADELKAEGFELPTFMETLTVVETERLTIRRFYKADLDALWAIMKKPEVMYAWESGFKKSEVRKWLNHQYTRYQKDGCGYFAVTIKGSGKLIGQAGLIKSVIDGENVVEIGYIFDNSVWGNGYAIEAARACADIAFSHFKLKELYAAIRPENLSSIKVAKTLGMVKTGAYIKQYQGKEMLHDVFVLK